MRKGLVGILAVIVMGSGLLHGQVPPGAPGGFDPNMPPGGGFDPSMGMPPGGFDPSMGMPPGTGFQTPEGNPIIVPQGFDGYMPNSFPDPTGAPPNADTRYTWTNVIASSFWVKVDYLLWLPKSVQFNFPVITTGPGGSTLAVGQPGVTTVLGNENVSYGATSGFRFTAGLFLDQDARFGVEASYLFNESQSESAGVSSSTGGLPATGLAFVNSNTGLNSALVTTGTGGNGFNVTPLGFLGPFLITPTNTPGTIGYVSSESSFRYWQASLHSVTNLFREEMSESSAFSLDLIAGVSYFDFNEHLNIQSYGRQFINTFNPFVLNLAQFATFTTPTFTRLDNGVEVYTQDLFKAHTVIPAGTIGLRSQYLLGRWSLLAQANFSLGYNFERVQAEGRTVGVAPVNPVTLQNAATTIRNTNVNNSGLFASGNNLGTDRSNAFSYIPEGNLQLGYRFSPNIRLNLGGSFLYMSRVKRPSELFSNQVNPAFAGALGGFGGQSTPVGSSFNTTSNFWMLGANAGLMFTY
ncbi:MAG: BBP7 family outer membrane beta-barrel protein [Zavarzinella sp.]